jgi:hypothetical protein
MTPSELGRELRRLVGLLDEGLKTLRESAETLAVAEREYRKAKGVAWVQHVDGIGAERQAVVDAETADLRYARDLAEGVRRAALESVRARQTQISALQSLAQAYRADAEFARTGPE